MIVLKLKKIMLEEIKIDGSQKEGGGQILRTSTALAAVTQKPCSVFNIRKRRDKPGLKTQHLLGLRALVDLCSGKLEGDKLESEEIRFIPYQIKPKKIKVKIDTAASITLILQTLLLPSLFAEKPVEIKFEGGATDTFFSPTFDHFRYIFLKIIEKMGVRTEINLIKRGYFPKGGAELKVKIFPSQLKPLNLTKRGSLTVLKALSGASTFLQEKKVVERQLAGVREVLGGLNLPIEEKKEYYKTDCPGSHICLIANFKNTTLGRDNLGKLGKRAEDVGKEAAQELLKEQKTETCLDKYTADQILPFMALSNKKSQITVSEITEHCKTNIWVIEKFLEGKFEIKENLISWIPK